MTDATTGRRNRASIISLLIVLSLFLSACGTLPESGPVHPGTSSSGAATAPDFSFRPAPPLFDANAQQIVAGFLRAATGPTDNWSVARQYLNTGTAWNPNAGVLIDDQAARSYTIEGGTDSDSTARVTLTVAPHASVNGGGTYTASSSGEVPLIFDLVRDENGQWRISSAPEGLLLSEIDFPNVFRRYEVMFFDPSWSFLVPDSRWFVSSSAPTRISMVLAGSGAAEWLSRAVVSAVPQDVVLAAPSVIVESGVAKVELSEQVLSLNAEGLARIQAQFEASLLGARVNDVVLSVGGVPIQTQQASVQSTKVPSVPLVLSNGSLPYQAGTSPVTVAAFNNQLSRINATSLQLSHSGDVLAAQDEDGVVWRINTEESVALDVRPNLIEPNIDPQGFVWSVPARSPQAVEVFAPGGQITSVDNAWVKASQILAMELSRDGTRVAAAVEVDSGYELWVAAVFRDRNGVPIGLGDPVLLNVFSHQPLSLSWLNESAVGVLLSLNEQGEVLVQGIGAPPRTISAPGGAVTIAGENTTDSFFLLNSSGELYALSGTHWQRQSSGIEVLGTRQGP